jgi:hypothetical protein
MLVIVDTKRNIATSLSVGIRVTWAHVCRKLPSSTQIENQRKIIRVYRRETVLNNKYVRKKQFKRNYQTFIFLVS